MFAGIAIVVASLGILGITLFEANIRLKELSIRKVLGASVTNLIRLLAREHIRILVISGCIATPLVYLFASKWLASYPIRIEISPAILLISMLVLVVIVVLTSCFQTIKAANTNPVDHLKHE
jgi:putative ABC transport system permease protein